MKTLKERSEDVIAQGCCTYSKKHDRFIGGVYPTHITSTRKRPAPVYGKVVCSDSKSYYDYTGGLGSHCFTANNNFGLPHEIEVSYAEKLREKIPTLEKMKFLKTGSEACLAAVRIARSFTNRKYVLGVGYHGWGDMFINAEVPGSGTIDGMYKKLPSFDELIKTLEMVYAQQHYPLTAAVIIEPVMLDIDVEKKLIKIRELCTKIGACLIYDEVITGFRFPDYCVANYFKPKPDILCLGKAIANGHPLSVVGGKKEIMDNPDYFVSSTFAGEYSSLNAAMSVLGLFNKLKLGILWARGIKFINNFNKISPHVQLVGYPTRCVWKGKNVDLFTQQMCKNGFLLGRNFFYSYHIEKTKELFLKEAVIQLKKINGGVITLEGNSPVSIFGRS